MKQAPKKLQRKFDKMARDKIKVTHVKKRAPDFLGQYLLRVAVKAPVAAQGIMHWSEDDDKEWQESIRSEEGHK